MINIIIFGVPGAGKGTQCKLLSEKLNLYHISTGDLIRKEISEKTLLGIQAENLIKQGALLDDIMVSNIFKHELSRNRSVSGFLFDGYPRTLKQAEIFDGILSETGININAFVELLLTEEESLNRITKRAAVEERIDDNRETVKKRFIEYLEKTAPVVNFYKKRNLYLGIDGTGEIEEINKTIIKSVMKLPQKN